MSFWICTERPDDSEPLVNYINVLIADEKYLEAKEKLNLLETKFPDEEHIDSLKKKISELVEDVADTKKKGSQTVLLKVKQHPKKTCLLLMKRLKKIKS